MHLPTHTLMNDHRQIERGLSALEAFADAVAPGRSRSSCEAGSVRPVLPRVCRQPAPRQGRGRALPRARTAWNATRGWAPSW